MTYEFIEPFDISLWNCLHKKEDLITKENRSKKMVVGASSVLRCGVMEFAMLKNDYFYLLKMPNRAQSKVQ